MNAGKATVRLTSNEVEAANRAEATARLIRRGYRVYAPESDCFGEDIVIRAPSGELRSVQLKSRPTINMKKYGGQPSIWMLFPDPKKNPFERDWFLVPHEQLYEWIKRRHGHAKGWKEEWSYPQISHDLREFLSAYSEANW